MNDAIRPAVARAALSGGAVVERAGGSHERHSPNASFPARCKPMASTRSLPGCVAVAKLRVVSR